MSKGILIGSSVALTVFIIALALSAYGLGREENNKAGPGYQAATAFAGITAVGVLVSLIVLIIAILNVPGAVQKASVFKLNSTPGVRSFQ